MSINFRERTGNPWQDAFRAALRAAPIPIPKSPRDFRGRSKYRPHQGAWECQRRLMQARGEWPRKRGQR